MRCGNLGFRDHIFTEKKLDFIPKKTCERNVDKSRTLLLEKLTMQSLVESQLNLVQVFFFTKIVGDVRQPLAMWIFVDE